MKRYKIYCAGPLFNPKEQEEMEEISIVLEKKGYNTFLPQRDGLELKVLSEYIDRITNSRDKTNRILENAIFALDIFQLSSSDALIINMNGRVPDEGAMVEAGVAWAAGKAIVLYKNDNRTFINGTDNPMILGLSNFRLVSNITEIPEKVEEAIVLKNGRIKSKVQIDERILEKGRMISEMLGSVSGNKKTADELVVMFKDEV